MRESEFASFLSRVVINGSSVVASQARRRLIKRSRDVRSDTHKSTYARSPSLTHAYTRRVRKLDIPIRFSYKAGLSQLRIQRFLLDTLYTIRKYMASRRNYVSRNFFNYNHVVISEIVFLYFTFIIPVRSAQAGRCVVIIRFFS